MRGTVSDHPLRPPASCLFSSSHASNYLPIRAWLPEGKQEILDLIDAAQRGEIGLKPEWLRAF